MDVAKARIAVRRAAALSPDERRVVALVLALKALLLLVGFIAYEVYKNEYVPRPHGWLDIWNQWDAPNYIHIAQHGYQTTGEKRFNLAFFPFFPLLLRGAMTVGLRPVLAAFVVAGIASVASGVLLYRLARLDLRPPAARRAVWFLFIFPTAYFLHIGMTEGTFLALTLAAFFAARRRKWVLAGMLGFLAAITRLNGWLLLPALAAEAATEYRETRRLNPDWTILGGIAAGAALYLVINSAVTGAPLTFLAFQRDNWSHQPDWPWHGLSNAFGFYRWAAPADGQMVGMQEFAFSCLGLAATVACCATMRPAYGVWMALNWLLWVSTDFIISTPRYMLILFPMFLLMGRLTANRLAAQCLTAVFLLLLGLFTSLWVQGHWAF